MGSQGSQSGISLIKETVWGTTPTAQFKGLNFTAEDMAFVIENKESNNVRPDRQITDVIQTGAKAEGGFETELQADNLDYLLPAAIWADADWLSPGTVGATNTDFAIETAGGQGGKITFNAAVSLAIVVGQFITIEGAVNSGNNGVFLVKGVVGQVVQVTAALVTEAATAGITLKGDVIRNGVTMQSFSIERAHYDISKFFLFKGMVPNTLEMNIEAEEIITANLTFAGKEDETASATASTGAPTALSIKPVMAASSSVSNVHVDDVLLESCSLQKMDFTFDNKAEGKSAVGVLGSCNITGKAISVTGNISLYFNDLTHYTKYKNGTAFSIDVTFFDSLGNIYIVQIANCKFDNATANVTGKDDDVFLEGTFIGTVGTNGYTLQFSRMLA